MNSNIGIDNDRRFRKYIRVCLIFSIVSILGCTAIMFVMTRTGASRSNTLTDTSERVFDYGGYMTESEITQLSEEIEKLERQSRSDLIVYTSSDNVSDSSAISTAEQFILDHDFGWNKSNGDCVLLYFNMTTRYVYVCTSGRAINIFDRNQIYDTVVEIVGTEAVDGNYYEGLSQGISRISWHMLMGKYMVAPFLFFLIVIAGTIISALIFVIKETSNLANNPVTISDYLKSRGQLAGSRTVLHTSVIHTPPPGRGGRGGGGFGGGGFGGGGGGHSGGGGSFGGGGGHF